MIIRFCPFSELRPRCHSIPILVTRFLGICKWNICFRKHQGLPVQILLMMQLWSVGIHGMNVVSAVACPLWQNNLQANIEGMDDGVAATHIVSEPFYHMYAHLGGSSGGGSADRHLRVLSVFQTVGTTARGNRKYGEPLILQRFPQTSLHSYSSEDFKDLFKLDPKHRTNSISHVRTGIPFPVFKLTDKRRA